MKTLMLNAEDLQTLGKLLPHAATTVGNHNMSKLQAANTAAANTTTTAIIGGGVGGALNLVDDRNLVTLQYYLKHPNSTYTTTTTSTATLPQQQQQQQQPSPPQQSLFVTQSQLKQLKLPTSTINNLQHQQIQQQQHQHINNYHHHSQQRHHHPYYQQQQPQQTSQQQQQQQNHQITIYNNASIINVPATTITTKTQYQQQQQQQTTKTPVLPVHALNQNSNFSAASSSTGGGTASSHAPTQQSNTTNGSSFSPPGATANKRNTPASSTTNNNNNNNNNSNTVSSTTTIGGRISGGNGGTKKLKTEPLLSQFHQSERLTFANSHMVWTEEHWKRVVFHDERKFNLDGPDGFSYYFHDLRNYERTLSQRPRGNSVFIYIVICGGGAIHLDVATTKPKPELCIEILIRERANIASKLGGNGDFLLQDHNWSANSLPTAQEWLSAEGIKLQKWPTISHDVNIMENIWGWLIREVYDGGRKFSRKDDLIFRIREAWTRLPLDLITNLYTTLPERISELYNTRGIYTNC